MALDAIIHGYYNYVFFITNIKPLNAWFYIYLFKFWFIQFFLS